MAACGGRSRRQKRAGVGVKRGSVLPDEGERGGGRCCHWSREREAPSGREKGGVTAEKKRGLQLLRDGGLPWFLVVDGEDGERGTLALWCDRRERRRCSRKATDDDSTCAEEDEDGCRWWLCKNLACYGGWLVGDVATCNNGVVAAAGGLLAAWWLAGSAGEGGKGSGEKNLACYGGWLVGDVATCNNGVVAAAGGLSTAWWLAGSTGEGGKGSGEVQWIRLSYRLVLQL
uniref:Uncharacterized protein n=1 Tax=Salix viminalis TaxID=40686 RepID=A0A6N2LU34_SALVM